MVKCIYLFYNKGSVVFQWFSLAVWSVPKGFLHPAAPVPEMMAMPVSPAVGGVPITRHPADAEYNSSQQGKRRQEHQAEDQYLGYKE